MLLKFLRKRKNMKIIMWGIAILIIPAFVIWGAGTSGKKDRDKPDYAGKIFGKKISYDEYADMWNVVRDYAMKTFGANVPTEIIDQMAWSRILLLEDAKRNKIDVGDAEIAEKIVSFPVFQRNGAFDKKLYKSMLADGARAFEEKIRDDLIISRLKENTVNGIAISDEEAKNEYRKKFEGIKISYALIPFAEAQKDVRYENRDLEKFYDSNKESFKKNEQVNIKYIEMPLSDFDTKTQITDEEIKRFFEENTSDFKKPDSDQAPVLDDAIKKEITSRLSFNKKMTLAEELAYKVLDGAIAKKDLEGPAKENSLQVKETGLFSMQDEIPGIGWSYEFAKAGFDLNPKEINNTIIKTAQAVYIIQLKEKKSSYTPTFSETKESVKEAYIKDMSAQLSRKNAEKILSYIKNKNSFESAASKHGLNIKQTGFIKRGDYIPELGPAMEIVENAFKLKTGEIDGPVKTLQAWAIIRPDETQPIDEAKFLQEKDKFKEELLNSKKEEVFNKYFEELRKRSGFVSYTNMK